MAGRTPTPNVMDALLGGAGGANAPVEDVAAPAPAPKPKQAAEPSEPSLEAPASAEQKPKPAKIKKKPTRLPGIKSKPPKSNPPESAEGEEGGPQDKATFSMRQETLDRLEQIWFDLRRGHYGKRFRVSKSEIAEIALEACLDDFEERLLESHAGQILEARRK